MNTLNIKLHVTVGVFAVFNLILSVFSVAHAEEENYRGFDSIVNDLSQTKTKAPVAEANSLDQVMIHFALSAVNNFSTVKSQGNQTAISNRGLGLHLGIDLFSPQWLAEGSFLNFGDQEHEEILSSLREFNLKILHQNKISKTLGVRFGGGIAGRYLRLENKKFRTAEEYSIPSSVISGMFETYLNQTFSLGIGLDYRTPIIDDVPETANLDLGLRLNGQF